MQKSILGAVLFSFLVCAVNAALNPAKPPGGNFDLSHWKLMLPLDKDSGANGTATEISAAQLVDGYTNAGFFRTAPDGAMVFETLAEGAIAGGHRGPNTHPRTELRELLNPKDAKANWSGNGVHILTAHCRVNALADGGRVCIGILPAGVFEATGSSAEDTEGLVDYARSVEGVDVGVLGVGVDSVDSAMEAFSSKVCSAI